MLKQKLFVMSLLIAAGCQSGATSDGPGSGSLRPMVVKKPLRSEVDFGPVRGKSVTALLATVVQPEDSAGAPEWTLDYSSGNASSTDSFNFWIPNVSNFPAGTFDVAKHAATLQGHEEHVRFTLNSSGEHDAVSGSIAVSRLSGDKVSVQLTDIVLRAVADGAEMTLNGSMTSDITWRCEVRSLSNIPNPPPAGDGAMQGHAMNADGSVMSDPVATTQIDTALTTDFCKEQVAQK